MRVNRRCRAALFVNYIPVLNIILLYVHAPYIPNGMILWMFYLSTPRPRLTFPPYSSTPVLLLSCHVCSYTFCETATIIAGAANLFLS